jgi:hypothetical protein
MSADALPWLIQVDDDLVKQGLPLVYLQGEQQAD